MFSVLFYILAICYCTEAAQLKGKLPSYFEVCSRSSPTLNQCIIQSGNKVIPRLVYGATLYNIPYMLPLTLSQIVIRNDYELRFIMRNVEVYGLEKTKITYSDWRDTSTAVKYFNPRLIILGDYELKGKILNVPVIGNGKANITLVNGRYFQTVTFNYNEDLYIKFISARLSYATERIIYHFDNLFNGNPFLGYQTGVFLNNNWKAVSAAFQPGAANAMNEFLVSVYQGIVDIVPLNELFLP